MGNAQASGANAMATEVWTGRILSGVGAGTKWTNVVHFTGTADQTFAKTLFDKTSATDLGPARVTPHRAGTPMRQGPRATQHISLQKRHIAALGFKGGEMLKRILIFICALGLGTLVLATPAGAAESSRAFRGEVAGQVHFVPTGDPDCTQAPFYTVSEGVGHTAHLGQVTMDSTHCSGNTIAGEMTFSGKHGSVVVSYSGACTPVPPFQSEITCNLTFDVTGGSGRFEGAEGSGTMTAKVHPDLSLPNPLEGVWPARWTFEGRIAY